MVALPGGSPTPVRRRQPPLAASADGDGGGSGNLTLAHQTSYALLSIPQLFIKALLDSFSLCTYANAYSDPPPSQPRERVPGPEPEPKPARMALARARKTRAPKPRRRAHGATCKVPIEPSR